VCANPRARGLTQQELAVALDVAVVQVSRWERGENEPRASHVKALAEILDVSADVLLDVSVKLNARHKRGHK